MTTITTCYQDNVPIPSFYRPLPSQSHIRILMVKPSQSPHDDVVCSIRTEDLRTGTYAALSYSWGMSATGDATLNRIIYIEGRSKSVTQNLFEGLRRIRSVSDPLDIWIDAVCINQDDISERNSQVAQMADIYRHAKVVLVWLGEGRREKEDNAIFEFLERIKEHKSLADRIDNWNSCVTSCLLDLSMDDCACQRGNGQVPTSEEPPSARHKLDSVASTAWLRSFLETSDQNKVLAIEKISAVVAFFSRRYWTRRWIVQELHFGKSQIWFWGAHSWDFTLEPQTKPWMPPLANIAASMWQLLCNAKDSHCDLAVIPDNTIRDYEDLSERSEAPTNLAYFTHDHSHDIIDLLRDLDIFECGDPRDRLFAVATLSKQPVIPDYSISFPQLCINFTRALIEREQNDWWYSTLRSTRDRVSRAQAVCLPSWVPDLRERLEIGGSDDHLSITFAEGDILVIQVSCLGIVQEVESNGEYFILKYDEEFGGDENTWTHLAQKPVRWNIPDPNSPGRDKVLHYHTYFARCKRLRPGDVFCSLTNVKSRWHPWYPMALRKTTDDSGTYRIVETFDGHRHWLDDQCALQLAPAVSDNHREKESHVTMTDAFKKGWIPSRRATVRIS